MLTLDALAAHTAAHPANATRTVESFLAKLEPDPPPDAPLSEAGDTALSESVGSGASSSRRSLIHSMKKRDGTVPADSASNRKHNNASTSLARTAAPPARSRLSKKLTLHKEADEPTTALVIESPRAILGSASPMLVPRSTRPTPTVHTLTVKEAEPPRARKKKENIAPLPEPAAPVNLAETRSAEEIERTYITISLLS